MNTDFRCYRSSHAGEQHDVTWKSSIVSLPLQPLTRQGRDLWPGGSSSCWHFLWHDLRISPPWIWSRPCQNTPAPLWPQAWAPAGTPLHPTRGAIKLVWGSEVISCNMLVSSSEVILKSTWILESDSLNGEMKEVYQIKDQLTEETSGMCWSPLKEKWV